MRLLSADPHKQRAERLLLGYTPLWMLVIGVLALTRRFAAWGDVGHMILGLALALPVWALPFVVTEGRPLRRRHLTRAVVFITLLAFVQNWAGARLFFVGLGMQYHFPTTWIWNGTPAFLYFVTVAYFATYFVLLQIGWRAAVTALPPALSFLRWPAFFLLCCGVAFGETFFMASDGMRPYFSYASKARALWPGSLCYGTLFLIAGPLYCAMDEERESSLGEVVWQALGANLLILGVYEVYLATILR